MRGSKKVTIEVSEKELLALEDMLTAWIVCKKGNRYYGLNSEVDLFKHQHECKACQAKLSLARKKALKIEGRLWSEYLREPLWKKIWKSLKEEYALRRGR